jgi:RNA polymerase sigma factor (sigma-70 family)
VSIKNEAQGRAFFEEAFRQFERKLVNYAFRLCGRKEMAQDAVGAAFLQLWNAEFSKVQESWPAWIYAVVRYRVIDSLRKDKKLGSLSEEQELKLRSDAMSSSEIMEEATRDSFLKQWMNELAPQQSEAIRLKFSEDLSYEQISKVMKISVSHVGVLIHNGVKILRSRAQEKKDEV